MASLFKKEAVVQEKSVIEIVRESIDVDAAGTVRFRSRTGRGSGKGVEIPNGQFDEFVDLMIKYRDNLDSLVEQEQGLQSQDDDQ